MGMHHLGEKEAPVPEGGRISTIDADGRIVPSVTVVVESPVRARETVAWYRAMLQERGWILDEGTWDEANDSRYHRASRKASWCGKEELELWVDEHEASATAHISITGEYAWDLPSRILVGALHSREGAAYPLGYSLYVLKNGDAGERVLMLFVGLPSALLMQALCIPGDILWWTI